MEFLILGVLIVTLVIGLCCLFFHIYKTESQQTEPENTIFEPYPIDKEEAQNILSGKEPLCGNHVNWLNEKEGLPFICFEDKVSEEILLYNYNRILKFAIKNGWIANHKHTR